MIRRIRAEDKKRVLEISSQIWEGDDYIAQVFDYWVADDGIFAGFWENNLLVGFGKLTFLSPTEIWLEGLRKDEKSGVSGVGEKLSEYYFQELKGRKIDSARFSTYFGNLASIRLNEKQGFEKILELSLKSKNIVEYDNNIPPQITNEIDYYSLKIFVENSHYLKDSACNISQGWVVNEYSDKLLKQFYDDQRFVVWLDNVTIKGCALWSDVHYKDVFWLSMLEVENEVIFREFSNYFTKLGIESGKNRIELLVPNLELLKYCNSNGFISWEQENDFFLYELPKHLINKLLTH